MWVGLVYQQHFPLPKHSQLSVLEQVTQHPAAPRAPLQWHCTHTHTPQCVYVHCVFACSRTAGLNRISLEGLINKEYKIKTNALPYVFIFVTSIVDIAS